MHFKNTNSLWASGTHFICQNTDTLALTAVLRPKPSFTCTSNVTTMLSTMKWAIDP